MNVLCYAINLIMACSNGVYLAKTHVAFGLCGPHTASRGHLTSRLLPCGDELRRPRRGPVQSGNKESGNRR